MKMGIGSKGDHVAKLQRSLGILADGVFGPKTQTALNQWVRTYQQLEEHDILEGLDMTTTHCVQLNAFHIEQIAHPKCKEKGLFYRTPNAAKVTFQELADLFNHWFPAYEMADNTVIAHYLPQIAHETDGLRAIEEYRNRDGSIPKHWHNYQGGEDAHGRGLIQTTHDKNYRKYFNHIGKQLKRSTLVTDPEHIVRSSLFYWVRGSAWGNINKYALTNDFLMITIAINGGFNGLFDRHQKLKIVIDLLGLNTINVDRYCLENSALNNTKNGKRIYNRQVGKRCI